MQYISQVNFPYGFIVMLDNIKTIFIYVLSLVLAFVVIPP